jgi:hypothetical protein
MHIKYLQKLYGAIVEEGCRQLQQQELGEGFWSPLTSGDPQKNLQQDVITSTRVEPPESYQMNWTSTASGTADTGVAKFAAQIFRSVAT